MDQKRTKPVYQRRPKREGTTQTVVAAVATGNAEAIQRVDAHIDRLLDRRRAAADSVAATVEERDAVRSLTDEQQVVRFHQQGGQ